MIDGSGRKIVSSSETKDINFMRAEAKFMMKSLRVNFDDEKAFRIAELILDFLKSDGKVEDIIDVIIELEGYAPMSRSESFFWRLVYIRRRIEESIKDKDIGISLLDNLYMCARHFDSICEIEPTLHNKACRILEYLYVVDYLYDNSKKETDAAEMKKILDNMKDDFSKIEEPHEKVYWKAGAKLSALLFNCRDKVKEYESEADKAFGGWIYCSVEAHRCDENYINPLGNFANRYFEYIESSVYSYTADEREHIELMIKWLAKAIESGKTGLDGYLEKFKKHLEKFENKNS